MAEIIGRTTPEAETREPRIIRLNEPFLLFDPANTIYEHIPQLGMDTIHTNLIIVEPNIGLEVPIIAEAGFKPHVNPSRRTAIDVVIRAEDLNIETLAKLAPLLAWHEFNLLTKFANEWPHLERPCRNTTDPEHDTLEYSLDFLNSGKYSVNDLYTAKAKFGRDSYF